MGEVRCERNGSIWTLVIDNQRRRNAFSSEMVRSFSAHLEEANNRAEVRALVVTGAGSVAFSSGHDLAEMLSDVEHAFDIEANAPFIRPRSMRMPVICAINGYAYAAGLILALACDIRLADEHANFAAPGAKVGLLPAGGQISRLSQCMPLGRVLELLYTGLPMSAKEAFDCGFVNRVTPAGGALTAAHSLAKAIAENSPSVLREIKKGMEVTRLKGVEAGDAFEWKIGKALLSSPDTHEGVSAFLEKRTPKFVD